MIDIGMPTLIELPEIDDCAGLCRELGLQFIDLCFSKRMRKSS